MNDVLAHDRAGAGPGTPVVLIHAGIADRRMWDDLWQGLTAEHDVVRIDLRGYGESADPPGGSWSARSDVHATLTGLGVDRAHLIGCSYGAGICVELALEHPELVASLLLVAPGGSLLTEETADLARFVEAEDDALERGDVGVATEINLTHWVDGPHRGPDAVPVAVRDAVGQMQRRAFEVTLPWPDAIWEAEDELDPEPTGRLGEISVPLLVLCGDLDMDAVRAAADLLTTQVPGARRVDWPDVAHLPSMERPDDFLALTLDWLGKD